MAQDNSKDTTKSGHPKGYPVVLYLYDISGGLAKVYSQALVGKFIEGIWHTSVVVYETEYFYGGGIQSSTPGQTPYGRPIKHIDLGHTCLPQSMLHDYLREVASRFSPTTYDLLKHNCNNFTDEVSQFLLGKSIPSWITGLPAEVMATPFGSMLKPMYEQMDTNMKAQLGSYYIDSEPHLPPVNSKYEELLTLEDEEENENEKNKNKDAEMKEKEQHQQQNVSETTKVDDSVKEKNETIATTTTVTTNEPKNKNIGELIQQEINGVEHLHKQMKWSSLKEWFQPKLTIDNGNANMYARIVAKQCELNELQNEHLNALVAYIEKKEKQPNKPLELDEDVLATLDELLLITEAENAFGLMSLLRVLVLNDEIYERYKDFLVVEQMLHKCGIPLVTEESNSDSKTSEISITDSDWSLLQFTTLGTVSHLYAKKKQTVSDSVLNMALSALKIDNTNVRLAASRVLFNICLQLKYAKFSNKDINNESAECKQLHTIIKAVSHQLDTETHKPIRLQLLTLMGLVLYCDDEAIKASSEVKNKLEKWKQYDHVLDVDRLADIIKLLEETSDMLAK